MPEYFSYLINLDIYWNCLGTRVSFRILVMLQEDMFNWFLILLAYIFDYIHLKNVFKM